MPTFFNPFRRRLQPVPVVPDSVDAATLNLQTLGAYFDRLREMIELYNAPEYPEIDVYALQGGEIEQAWAQTQKAFDFYKHLFAALRKLREEIEAWYTALPQDQAQEKRVRNGYLRIIREVDERMTIYKMGQDPVLWLRGNISKVKELRRNSISRKFQEIYKAEGDAGLRRAVDILVEQNFAPKDEIEQLVAFVKHESNGSMH